MTSTFYVKIMAHCYVKLTIIIRKNIETTKTIAIPVKENNWALFTFLLPIASPINVVIPFPSPYFKHSMKHYMK